MERQLLRECCCARIRGLSERPDLNDRLCHLSRFHDGRWIVRLDGGGVEQLRPESLCLVPASDKWGIQAVPGKGLGIVAKIAIARGEKLLSELHVAW